ncbi:contractile injection system protein, VgrG/Pvc8 family, partial [Pseudomonas protegens]
MAITQNNRLVQVDSPLGGDVLLLQSMEGNEELGRLFHYELDLTSENRAITFDQLLGKPMGLTLELHDGSKRYFHGIVCSCRQVNGHGQFAGYRVSLRPWLWLLTRTSDCRI